MKRRSGIGGGRNGTAEMAAARKEERMGRESETKQEIEKAQIFICKKAI